MYSPTNLSISPLRAFILLLALALAGPAAQAQPTAATAGLPPFWRWQGLTPQGYTLRDVAQLNDSAAVAVGDHGVALKTTDRGRTWAVLPTGTNQNLLAVSFADAQTGWVIYNSPLPNGQFIETGPPRVRRTTNGGQTWTQQNLPVNANNTRLSAVQALSPTEAYVLVNVGNTFTGLFHTTDGGQTWLSGQGSLPAGINDDCGMHFTSATMGWLAGSAGSSYFLLYTPDGGQSWQDRRPDSTAKYASVFFLTPQQGWVGGQDATGGVVYATTDGGTTWQTQRTSPANSGYVTTLSFADATHGMVFDGNFLRTADGGQTWSYVLPFSEHLGVNFTLRPSGTGFMVGRGGKMMYTANFGVTWAARDSAQTRRTLYDIDFPDPTHGWVLGGSNSTDSAGTSEFLVRTADRGATWRRVPLNSAPIVRWGSGGAMGGGGWGSASGASFADQDTGFVVVVDSDVLHMPRTFSLRTTDAGQSWQTTQLPGASLFGPSIRAYDSRRAAIFDYRGKLFVTHDGGQTWQAGITNTTNPLRSVSWIDAQNLYVVGDSSTVLKSTDGGLSWLPAPSPYLGFPDRLVYNVNFISSQVGFIDTFRTLDGGQTWQGMQSPQRGVELGRSVFRDARHGWNMGGLNVYATADTGRTWTIAAWLVTTGGETAPTISGVLIDRYNGFTAGTDGGILRYSEKFVQADTALSQRTYCAGDSLLLAFTTEGTFGAAERDFRVELSNVRGRFRPGQGVLVGRGAASPLRVRLPATLAEGTRYRLRVIRRDSSVLGGDNGHDLTIHARVAAAIAPAGPQALCQGDSLQLTAPAGYAVYQWSTGATTPGVWVRAAGSYSVQVGAAPGCLGPAAAPVVVSVEPRPGQPIVTPSPLSGAVLLTSSAPSGNQWYLNGQPIAGATGPTYFVSAAAQNGTYTVQVTSARGCISPLSAPQVVTVTGLPADTGASSLTLTPNPAADAVLVTLVGSSGGAALRTVTLTDLTGRVVLALPAAGTSLTLPLRAVPSGTYLLRVTTITTTTTTSADGRAATRRLVVVH